MGIACSDVLGGRADVKFSNCQGALLSQQVYQNNLNKVSRASSPFD